MKKHSKDAQEKKEFINAVAERMAKYYWNYNKGFEDGKNIGKTQALKDELKVLQSLSSLLYDKDETFDDYGDLIACSLENIEDRIIEIKSQLKGKE